MDFSWLPNQEFYLYRNGWTAEMDSLLISSLMRYKSLYGWTTNSIPDEALADALLNINFELVKQLEWSDIVTNIKKLQKRYDTFKELVDNTKYMQYHSGENLVTGEDTQWNAMIRKNTFARVYYRKGEPEFLRLGVLFGETSVKDEHPKIVINLCSSTSKASKKDIEADEDEVNSPMLKVNSPVLKVTKRGLFDDEFGGNDVASTTAGPSHFPSSNAFPPRYRTSAGEKEGTSSCASTSPHPLLKNPFW